MKNEQHRIILVGRPNSGKSSLYNALTGGQAHVGNYPGVTVDILEGDLDLLGTSVTLIDLPGLYSITRIVDPGTDEGVARVFLEAAKADPTTPLVMQVIDVTQLELSLKLTHELIELGMPMLVVLTQSDLLDDAHQRVDRQALSEAIGVPVILASARDRSTLPALLQAMKDGGTRSSKRGFNIDEAVKATLLPGAHRRESVMDRADALLLHPLLGPIAFGIIMTALFAAVFFGGRSRDIVDGWPCWTRTQRDHKQIGDGPHRIVPQRRSTRRRGHRARVHASDCDPHHRDGSSRSERIPGARSIPDRSAPASFGA